MAELKNCPWRDELQLMVLGKLDRSRAEAIAHHLDTCSTCLDALREWIVSDEILEAVQAGCSANSEPTKTMYLPIGRIRDAVSTWLVARDETCTDHQALPPSLADFKTVLSPPQSSDEIGRIADFRVLRLLGIGGMAAVFEAEDPGLKRRVALKILHPALAERASSGGTRGAQETRKTLTGEKSCLRRGSPATVTARASQRTRPDRNQGHGSRRAGAAEIASGVPSPHDRGSPVTCGRPAGRRYRSLC